MPDEMKRPGLGRNLISQSGVVLAVVALANLVFLIYLDSIQTHPNPYLGIMTWIIAPAILIAGLLLYIGGMLLERRRRRRRGIEELPEFPRIDLNNRRTRMIIGFSTVGIITFVMMSIVGSYQVYHYTESDAFCGTVCHEVMTPEYTAYQQSPHARVGCVACHIGSGATWFVKSKVTGSYQLYSIVTRKFPRPIPSPVNSLRPARDTCEQCHWPEKYFGVQLKTFDHFSYDETNTPLQVRMLINTGGGSAKTGAVSGIHWHMNLANEITYLATDAHRQQIPWVRIRNRQSGQVTVYKAQDSKLTDAQIAAGPKRRFDCIDCHSRPTHIYVPPDRSVDRALAAGHLDKTLPYMKQQAVAVLVKDYTTTPQALRTIATELPAYYQKTYPAVYSAKRPQLDQAVTTLQQIFSSTRFPEMRVDWRTHPDNVGHFFSAGCFRCHDDQHVSSDGRKISKECTVCHSVLNANSTSAEFQHPVDMGDPRSLNCADCHNGGGM